ncbi:hypothetical protein CHS0354_024362 [Potamilus streckersoni]|uniref:Ig-like domain-containing protein n=1 Tax=Potamilus streckersoni TaxID=2493646 RepID=A0AAE0SUY1_9BIVA|nr:hypothetical protein CHS0354_024362 [Potamilus streckersoni]
MMIQEYSGLNVSCLADCYPICSWKWEKLNSASSREDIISAESTLHIQNITRHRAGKYSCRVKNKITGIELENFTSFEIVYGPNVIIFNLSDKTIQLNENDSVTISCSADCFPPCQMSWTKMNAEIVIPSAELKLVNVKINGNYTCHSTNPRKDNSTISDTICVTVKSGPNHHTTTALRRKGNTQAIDNYTTTVLNQKGDIDDFPSKRHLLYIVLGMGAILAFGFIACLLHKVRICSDVQRVPNCNTLLDSNKDGGDEDSGDENLQEAKLAEHYWTIVSGAQGELSTAIETGFEAHKQQQQITRNKSEQSIRPSEFQVNEELDGYLNPASSRDLDLEYIHPIHSDIVNIPLRNISEHSLSSEGFQVNEELSRCINPNHSHSVEIGYIHPLQSEQMNIDPVPTCRETEV